MTTNFLETDASTIYDETIESLTEAVEDTLYPGDERRIMGEAMAMVLMTAYNVINDAGRQRMLKHARGEVLDAIGDDIERLQPSPASAMFRFRASAPQGKNIIIPKGTRITPDGEIYFATDTVAIIYAGDLEVNVNATCMVAGEQYNDISEGKISTLVDLIPFISEVLNVEETNGGDEGEPYTDEGDEKYRERIRLASAAYSVAGPVEAYKYHTLSADASIVDAYIDNPSACVIDIYPILQGGEIPDEEMIDKIQKVFSGEIRPQCDLVTVRAPQQIEYEIKLKYYCTAENEADAVRLVESAGGAIDSYINWQSNMLGRAINPDALRREILTPVGVESVVDRVEILAPIEFKQIEKYQIAKIPETVQISHEIT